MYDTILGCPIRQEIRAIIPATACGDGLIKGIAGQVQSFVVDPQGQKGELVVQIEGWFFKTYLLVC